MSDRVRLIKIPASILAEFLHLPETCQIIDVRMDFEQMRGMVAIKVTSPDFSPVPEGSFIPSVSPKIEEEYPVDFKKVRFTGWAGA